MEKDKMSASFHSICANAGHSISRQGNGAELKALVACSIAENKNEENAPSECLAPRSAEPSAREAFSSIVSAATCANITGADILESYTTLTPKRTSIP